MLPPPASLRSAAVKDSQDKSGPAPRSLTILRPQRFGTATATRLLECEPSLHGGSSPSLGGSVFPQQPRQPQAVTACCASPQAGGKRGRSRRRARSRRQPWRGHRVAPQSLCGQPSPTERSIVRARSASQCPLRARGADHGGDGTIEKRGTPRAPRRGVATAAAAASRRPPGPRTSRAPGQIQLREYCRQIDAGKVTAGQKMRAAGASAGVPPAGKPTTTPCSSRCPAQQSPQRFPARLRQWPPSASLPSPRRDGSLESLRAESVSYDEKRCTDTHEGGMLLIKEPHAK